VLLGKARGWRAAASRARGERQRPDSPGRRGPQATRRRTRCCAGLGRRWVQTFDDESMGAGQPAEGRHHGAGLDYRLPTAFTLLDRLAGREPGRSGPQPPAAADAGGGVELAVAEPPGAAKQARHAGERRGGRFG
jgi:hypothetical protein